MTFIMFLHITMGTIAVLAGAAALFVRKGSRVHRGIGNVFFITMMIMAAAGIYLAFVLPMAISVLVAVFTIYLVATSWMAARQYDENINLLHYVALAMTLGVAASGLWFGMEAQNSPDGLKDGLPAFPHYFFGALALLTALGDAVMIVRRGISGKQRIARHLWRMCFAYFIAAGSLFTGPGATAFPKAIRDTGLLSAPEPIILAVMLFWVVRVLATKWYEGKPM
ncbi:MAG: hypothetical protein ABJP02_02825 [Parasphingorhabdus sp.]|uniref:hypothetical protein n=1 Tax=Parasphingorhabdus sp. TaxID=2709688 RepID=UPI003297A053